MKSFLNKNKKLFSFVTLVVTVGLVGFAITNAIFSDEETSSGNVFVAGSLDLKVGSECHYNGMKCVDEVWVEESTGSSTFPEMLGTSCSCTWLAKDLDGELYFNFADVKPGDFGENTIDLTVIDNDAYVCAIVDNLKNYDNGCTGPEKKAEESAYGDGLETCGEPGEGEGELQDNLLVTVWRDTDCDNVLDPAGAGHCAGPVIPAWGLNCPAKSQAQCTQPPCIWVPGSPAEEVLVSNVALNGNEGIWSLGQLEAEQETCYGVAWSVPLNTGNIIQTDSVTADLTFYVEQARNNPNFSCSSLVTPVPQ